MKKKTPEATFITVVPDHRELAPGTLKAILRQSSLTREELIELLKT